jgi:hypothetical protein
MKYISGLLMVFHSFLGMGQRLHADLYGGISNYQGDLQGKIFTLNQAGVTGGIGFSYDLTRRFILRATVNFARIEGNDKYNIDKDLRVRNLNFKTNILEGQLATEFNLLDISAQSFSPYIFAGVAIYHYDPYTFNTAGQKIFLQPLGTEGQGISQYAGKIPYKLTHLAIPFGGGLKVALSENLQLGIEMGFRKLFTDYLDDVSTQYADSSLLAAARGPQAVALAYRGDELAGGAPYPPEGSQRGNPKLNDWYYMTVLRISYLLGKGSQGNRKSKTGCPVNIY